MRDEVFTVPYSPATGTGIVRTGTLTHNSPVVTGLPSTTNLLVGMTVTGIGIPDDTTIQTIDSASQVTLTKAAVLNATRTAVQINPPYYQIDVGNTVNLWAGMTAYCHALNVQDVMVLPWGSFPGTVVGSIDSASLVTMVDHVDPVNTLKDAPVEFTVPSPAQPLRFGGGKRLAEAAIEVVRQVFPDILCLPLNNPDIITRDTFCNGTRSDALADLATAAAVSRTSTRKVTICSTSRRTWKPSRSGRSTPAPPGYSSTRTNPSTELRSTNGVLVVGQASGDTPPFSALVTDDDPTSPTRWGGPFGKITRIESSTAVGSLQPRPNAATVLLEERLGLTRSLTLTEAPNPALEARDVIRVLFPDGRDERHIIDAVRVDLGTGEQTITSRSVYTPAAGLARQLPPPRRRGLHLGAQAWREAAAARKVTV